MKTKIVLSAALALFAHVAMASDKPAPAVNASNKASFDTVSEWVRKQMESGGRYSSLKGKERDSVNGKLDDMSKLFEAHGDVAQMSDADRTRLFNDQEEINNTLAKRDGERLICRSERPIGSNIPVKTCQTASEIEERRRNDVKDFRTRQDAQVQLRGGG